MADPIHVDIVTPEQVLYRGTADMVTAPGTVGEFGILPGHAAFVTTLEAGQVTVKNGTEERRLAIAGGFAQVLDDKVIVLADAAAAE